MQSHLANPETTDGNAEYNELVMSDRTTLLVLFFVTAGLWAQSPDAAASQKRNEMPSARDPFTQPQTKVSERASQPTATPAHSTRLEPVSTPAPAYPKTARGLGLQGKVVIHLEISETGEVESATPVSGEPILAEAAAEAMKTWKFKPYIKSGKAVRVRTEMPYSFVLHEQEAQEASATAPGAGQPSQSLTVPYTVLEGRKIHDVAPEYPLAARAAHIQGNVIFHAIIGKDGLIHNLQVVSGHPVLALEAMKAVKQWRYRPYIQNGEPVEVETFVRVQFRLPG
jgi:TonB family protein